MSHSFYPVVGPRSETAPDYARVVVTLTDDELAAEIAGGRGDPGYRAALEAAAARRPPPDRDDWPVHQPEVTDAPIPGKHWYDGCEPGGDPIEEMPGHYHGVGPRVNPVTGVCEGCGAHACPVCGRESCPDHQ